MSTISLSLLAACASAAEPDTTATAATPAAAPRSGIDLRTIDPAVRPQDDFFLYLNGNWLKNTAIPPDKSSWGEFAILREQILPQLRGLIEARQQDKNTKPGSEGRKIADLYASFMDEVHIESMGLRPLAGELSRIQSIRDKKGLPGLIARLDKLGVGTPYSVYVGLDARDPTRYAAAIGQSGLGLPDRDYYLDEKYAKVLAQYRSHIEKTLALAGGKNAAASAEAVVALETALAKAQWNRVELRDPVKRYNKMAIAALAELAPAYDWKHALAAAGVATKTDEVIVDQPGYLKEFNGVLERTELASWQRYFEWQLLRKVSPYLSKPFAELNFAFYGKVLSGASEQLPRWQRGVAVVEFALGDALGKLYVAEYFPPERKARMEGLVANLMAAYRDSIATLDWMGPETREAAQAKLASFRAKIGYPGKWRDYAPLAIVPGDLVGNVLRAANAANARMIARLGRPIDKEEWGMSPQTVNAYYHAELNEVVFPAAILQPPFFDAGADDAVNYGAIGAVIGHEISHGFDDKGSQYDGSGMLRDWWSPADRAAFQSRAGQLERQYGAYQPLPGHYLNGALTLGENIADNAGLAIAYKAYQLSLAGQPAPVIDGFSGAQRFYMGFAQIWRVKMRDAQMMIQVQNGPHSPGQFRANGSLVNQPGFHAAFGTQPGDRMYRAPEQRVLIW
ncbi:M13 family metallopeptidase [Oxalobacteraceae bacterium]|nr:M13 family metallopeptidase [Oxalobacteraceae bacterium]